jgi:Domain of unknown function (DUF4252)
VTARRLRRSAWVLMGLLPGLAAAQAGRLVIPDFSDLARKATGTVDITLDGDMLKSATQMMGAVGGLHSGDTDLSGVVAGLKAISVRSFTFDKPDMYSPEVVAGILAQVDVPGWHRVVSVRQKGEHVEVHMRADTADGGLLVVSEEPRELTIVNIAGKINLEQLRALQGHLGVPILPGIIGDAAPAVPAAPAATPSAAPAQPPATRER